MILKRAFDILVAAFGLLVFSPLLLLVMLAIWLQDFRSPFYIAARVARGGGSFNMVKFRSMVLNADKIGGIPRPATTGALRAVGRFVRAYKIDELIQLWNVLKGDMSLVGPRPQVQTDARLYTDEESECYRSDPASPTPPPSSSLTKATFSTAAPTRTFSTIRSSVHGKAAWLWPISTTARFAWTSG